MDLTAMDNVEIDWVITNALPICLKVKAGTDVVWQVTTGQTFATHPVEQFPVDPTSPIDELYNEANDDDYTVPFPNPGTFGFRCNIHQGVMRGSIWVVP
jgi:plastocyanin